MIYLPEFNENFDEEIQKHLSEEEMNYLSTKSKKQTAILYLQSKHLSKL